VAPEATRAVIRPGQPLPVTSDVEPIFQKFVAIDEDDPNWAR
jgi:hypothetical protein